MGDSAVNQAGGRTKQIATQIPSKYQLAMGIVVKLCHFCWFRAGYGSNDSWDSCKLLAWSETWVSWTETDHFQLHHLVAKNWQIIGECCITMILIHNEHMMFMWLNKPPWSTAYDPVPELCRRGGYPFLPEHKSCIAGWNSDPLKLEARHRRHSVNFQSLAAAALDESCYQR